MKFDICIQQFFCQNSSLSFRAAYSASTCLPATTILQFYLKYQVQQCLFKVQRQKEMFDTYIMLYCYLDIVAVLKKHLKVKSNIYKHLV